MKKMKRLYFNKLIRDRIPEKIERKGQSCEVRVIADDVEFRQELFKKIREEADALSRSKTREEFLSEYADLMAVLDALTAAMEFSEADIKTAVTENMERKGGFNERLFLHSTSDDGYESNETPQGVL